jgi:hypothetical protein
VQSQIDLHRSSAVSNDCNRNYLELREFYRHQSLRTEKISAPLCVS